jgi:hypothetical protein
MGKITYDSEYGHVCSCSEELHSASGEDGEGYYTYARTVNVCRDIEPTESGSWLYACSDCGATAWSGC